MTWALVEFFCSPVMVCSSTFTSGFSSSKMSAAYWKASSCSDCTWTVRVEDPSPEPSASSEPQPAARTDRLSTAATATDLGPSFASDREEPAAA